MKARAFFVLAAVLAGAAACRSAAPLPVRVELPGPSPFPPGSFAEIIVANFRDDAPIPDFDTGLELQAYLAAELGRSFKGKVSRLTISPGGAPGSAGPSFWKDAGAGRDRAVFLAGSMSLASQVRKAIKGKNVPVGGPFNVVGRGLFEQLHWAFTVDLAVISAATGEILFQKTFREERDYSDIEKPADFAFSELSDRFRAKLLAVLLGASTIESRTLLRR